MIDTYSFWIYIFITFCAGIVAGYELNNWIKRK